MLEAQNEPMTRSRALSFTNRKGQVYYLHAGLTKTGKRRFFVAKTVGDDAVAELPAGFEIVESINGVVSVRRIDPAGPRIPDIDLARLRAELAKHPHLRRHRADAVKGEIIVFEPVGGLSDEMAGGLMATLGLTTARIERARPELEKRTRFTPVMRLVPLDGGQYALFRMTYCGEGGWSRWALDRGPLEKLAATYVKHVGTDRFFELY